MDWGSNPHISTNFMTIIETYVRATGIETPDANLATISVVETGETLLEYVFEDKDADTVKAFICAIRVLEQKLVAAGAKPFIIEI